MLVLLALSDWLPQSRRDELDEMKWNETKWNETRHSVPSPQFSVRSDPPIHAAPRQRPLSNTIELIIIEFVELLLVFAELLLVH